MLTNGLIQHTNWFVTALIYIRGQFNTTNKLKSVQYAGLLWLETQSLNVYYGTFYSRRGESRGQYFNTLKDSCLVSNVIGWLDKKVSRG